MDEEYAEVAGSIVLGSKVLIETETGLEAGVLVGYNDMGLHLKALYREDTVPVEVDDKQIEVIREMVAGLTWWSLRRYASEAGVGNVWLMKRGPLMEAAAVMTARNLATEKPVLKALSRPISKILPFERVLEINSFDEWYEESMLRGLDFHGVDSGEESE